MKRVAFGFITAFALLASAGLADADEAERIVVVGDVHGAHAPLALLLSAAGLIDAEGHWSGGEATLVQLGDLIDRGPSDRDVLELMMSLEREAEKDGGRVVVLLGNHELMNLIGDWRYVSSAGIASFGGRPQRREALAPKGKYGKWLRERPAVELIDGTLFVHGGLIEEVTKLGLRGIRMRVREEISRLDKARARAIRSHGLSVNADFDGLLGLKLPELAHYGNWLIANAEGPFWYRGYQNWDDAELEKRLPGILAAVGAKRVVVGHSVQLPAAIRLRADARAILVDTGMLGAPIYPGGAPLALEIRGERLTSIALDGTRTVLRGEAAPVPAAAPTK